MTAAPKLAGFATALAVLFGVGALAGGLLDPDRGASAEPAHGGEMGDMDAVRGLAVAEDDLRLVVATPELARGRDQELRFRVVDTGGETVRDFDVEHTKRMHLIVARRDLTGFQHLHPRQRADGSWTTDLRVKDAGSYRMFADFSHDSKPVTLAADLRVDGPADLQPLPAPSTTATSDGGYDVRLDRDGERLRFTVTRDGRPVHTQPYLGAGGHLVALREGDLAFLHVHPAEDNSTTFDVEYPTPGRYRLFLQFQVEGQVNTVAFTQEVA
jgi:hypothetical protein